VRRIVEAPAPGDGQDTALGQGRVLEITAAVVEAALPHPAAHRGALVVEQPVKVAHGDVVGAGYRLGVQAGLAQVPVDPGARGEQQGSAHRRRVGDRPTRTLPEHGGQQVQHVVGQAGVHRALRTLQVEHQPAQERPYE